jgi:Xaa-Pro aminopeptidase
MGDHASRRMLVLEEIGSGAVYGTGDPVAVRYLTGFTGSSAVIGVGVAGVTLVTDGRYRDQVTQESPDVEVVIDRGGPIALARLLAERGVARVITPSSTSYSLVEQMRAILPQVDIAEDPVLRLRRVKDSDELLAVRRACAITAEALMDVARGIRVGDREVDIARRLEAGFGARGAEDRAFPTIVAAGPHSAIPHHRPTARAVAAGDLLVIDCGARVQGYHADMTRTFLVGRDPEDGQRDIHVVVAEAAEAGRRAVVAGAACSAVDAAAREIITRAGYGENFTHGTGHAVGLVIHEAPMVNPESLDTLAAGMAVTVEPGIYLPLRGGVRIEDTLEVTHGGSVVLTEAPRDLVRVG